MEGDGVTEIIGTMGNGRTSDAQTQSVVSCIGVAMNSLASRGHHLQQSRWLPAYLRSSTAQRAGEQGEHLPLVDGLLALLAGFRSLSCTSRSVVA